MILNHLGPIIHKLFPTIVVDLVFESVVILDDIKEFVSDIVLHPLRISLFLDRRPHRRRRNRQDCTD
tara:strand:+ start:128 stop:328 length:201 start_codon:yes stop_codon:yes gene_type:complete